ncbi:hypothetical protein A1OE_1248 [Candidatus Endolissoclinum faulkneri L2]|uniref:Uncharacterized protein n=1 Tax=Candidatus Endolissoclinum faulkneri L2 TaxID=1193729 RepID=K7YPI0_9PROT|nr:hypothetical protein A1OE_1248 [Candidatus Endolissoclinum faulkneri L2]
MTDYKFWYNFSQSREFIKFYCSRVDTALGILNQRFLTN